MKELHLICNSHIDPAWMWDWHEGCATAISTFYSAVELLKEYDFVFCHNEALLYEYVEKYDPQLFDEIKKLVAEGKWIVVGGWYLQPDCNIPSGEAFVRQIRKGQRYFKEKFGVESKTAFNVDSFGHNIGLPQILKKCGQENYIICRPMPEVVKLGNGIFKWIGVDGSAINTFRVNDGSYYTGTFGAFKGKLEQFESEKNAVLLWGVGNHGGGPSRKDLNDIAEFAKEKKDEWKVIHSTPEKALASLDYAYEVDYSLLPCFIKCYSSMSSIKKANRGLENALFQTETIAAIADKAGKIAYDFNAFDEAERALCHLQFHDVLAGTVAPNGEETSLMHASAGRTVLRETFERAFMALCEDEKKAGEDEFPIFVFNPLPHEVDTVVETELLSTTCYVGGPFMNKFDAYQSGKKIDCQIIKEISNIAYDRRKRIAIRAKLKPMGLTRIDLKRSDEPRTAKQKVFSGGEIDGGTQKFHFGENTKGLCSYQADGEEYVCGHIRPVMFDDNADPWGWDLTRYHWFNDFKMEEEYADGIFGGLKGKCRSETGCVLDKVETRYRLKNSLVEMDYKLYKNANFFDIEVDAYWNERLKGLKIAIPVKKGGKLFGQMSFAQEALPMNGDECTAHSFVAIDYGDKTLAVFNDGIYSFSFENDTLYLTLLNGAAYCAHPVGLPLLEEGRYIPFIEQGKRSFKFRVGVFGKEELENKALEFERVGYSLNHFPHGKGEKVGGMVELNDEAVSLQAFKKSKDGGYILRLFNGTQQARDTEIAVGGVRERISFTPFEVKTYRYQDGKLTECDGMVV